jgi:hypothetical protein
VQWQQQQQQITASSTTHHLPHERPCVAAAAVKSELLLHMMLPGCCLLRVGLCTGLSKRSAQLPVIYRLSPHCSCLLCSLKPSLCRADQSLLTTRKHQHKRNVSGFCLVKRSREVLKQLEIA